MRQKNNSDVLSLEEVFEIGKLGFDEPCDMCYSYDEKGIAHLTEYSSGETEDSEVNEAPTYKQAYLWLIKRYHTTTT